MKRPDKGTFAAVAGLLAVWTLLGWGLFHASFEEQQRAVASRTWPTVPGTVLRAERVTRDITLQGRTTKRISAEVEYAFVAGGRPIKGTRTRFGIISSEEAAAILVRLRAGDTVPVHYDPLDPTTSVLFPPEPGRDGWIPPHLKGLFAVFVTLPAVLLAVVILVSGKREPRTRRFAMEVFRAVSGAHGKTDARPELSVPTEREGRALVIEAQIPVKESLPDEEWYRITRHWRFLMKDERVELRRWINHADQVGAAQSIEIDCEGFGDFIPAPAREWLESFKEALRNSRCLVQASQRSGA